MAELTKADFASDCKVRWCPGCGDFMILNVFQDMLASQGKQPHNVAVISGIGCSSRFPYYMGTYGFHTIHGRAPAAAIGVKEANPDLETWVITGDGDAMSIGGNHFYHAIRRNHDLKILMFNNSIYGLTKGQYAPTSKMGTVTGSSPSGSIDYPINTVATALGANGAFVARSVDNDKKHLAEVMRAASEFSGTAMVELYVDCITYQKGIHNDYTSKSVREKTLLYLEHGKPMLFGEDNAKGVILDGLTPKVVDVTDANKDQILIHNTHDVTGVISGMLAQFQYPEFPVPVGVFRSIEKPTYGDMLNGQIKDAQDNTGVGTLDELLNEGQTWEIK
ncbi:MAG: 2-oxoacid:ferredoxin oxidoreductase subunit beta [Fibrobacterales bacterium]